MGKPPIHKSNTSTSKPKNEWMWTNISRNERFKQNNNLYNGKFNQLGRQGKVEVKGNEVYCSIENFQKYAKCQAYFYYKKPAEIKIPDLQYCWMDANF